MRNSATRAPFRPPLGLPQSTRSHRTRDREVRLRGDSVALSDPEAGRVRPRPPAITHGPCGAAARQVRTGGPRPREARHARPRAAVRCVPRKPANRGAARDRPNAHGKEQPGALLFREPNDNLRPGPRKARSARLLSIGTVGSFQTLAVTQQGLQRLALRRVFRQGLLPRLSEECLNVVLKFLLRLVQRFVRSPWNAAVAWRCDRPRFGLPLRKASCRGIRVRRSRAAHAPSNRRARSDSATPWPASCKRNTGIPARRRRGLRTTSAPPLRCGKGHPYSVLANPEPAAGTLAFLTAGVNRSSRRRGLAVA